MTFAALQSRLNAKALERFGAVHSVDGQDVQGDFVSPGKKFTINDVSFEAQQPLLVVVDGDVPADPDEKPVVCEGTTYAIQRVESDGHGLSVLYLQRGK